VIEEAPSPAVTPELRSSLGEAAVTLARAAGYEGAGTAEFLLTPEGQFYFLELNARLQVEHPVTELVTGRDLVADQLRIAAGEPLGFEQAEVALHGHAVEARLYAEDPDHDFLPATGDVLEVRWPEGEDVRVDAGVGAGDVVGTRYDPLLAKLITHAGDRAGALRALDRALADTAVLGVTTNRGFLRWLAGLPEVAGGSMHTQLIDERWRPRGEDLPEAAWEQAALALARMHSREGTGMLGFRLNQRPRLRLRLGSQERAVTVPAGETRVAPSLELDSGEVVLDLDGRSLRARLAPPPTVEAAVRHAAHLADGGEAVTAPMPGNVLQLRVSEGDEVEAGQVLLVLEAMKMENTVPAPASGRVARVHVEAGQQVQRGDRLVEVT
jgi:acetyl/propionyl-CoA carboxylase alpha subunit